MEGYDDKDPNGSFFLTTSGEPAIVSKGMFQKFADAVGLPSASANTLQKGATTNLLEDPIMKNKESTVMDHSEKTADLHYDQGRTRTQVTKK